MSESRDRQRVVVTGATRGIGFGIARRFVQSGARVVVTSRKDADARSAAARIDAGGTLCHGLAYDAADAHDSTRLAAEAVALLGGVDVLCVNAGIFPAQSLAEMTASDVDTILNTNLRGTILSVVAFLEALKASPAGRVIITSSITGPITGYPGWSHYGASKAGQLGFMRTAAIELAPFGITVNAVLPGNILTEGLEAAGEHYLETMAQAIPMKRLGSVDDIANTALFLASKEAGFITGQQIVVDGGQTLPESAAALDGLVS